MSDKTTTSTECPEYEPSILRSPVSGNKECYYHHWPFCENEDGPLSGLTCPWSGRPYLDLKPNPDAKEPELGKQIK